MEVLSKGLLSIHVIAGFISIVLFWLPMFSKKGGDFHVKTGKLYVISMWVVVIAAFLLSIKNVIVGNYFSAIFLGFLTVITSGPLWYGIAILDQKKGNNPAFKRKRFYMDIIVLMWAIGMIAYGLSITNSNRILMFIFGGLGLTALPDVIKYIRGRESRLTKIQEHLIGMITTGIAAYTAFFVFGGQTMFGHLFKGYWAVILWVGPGVLGTFANFYFSKKYEVRPKVA